MQIVSDGDNLHEMSPCSVKIKKKYFNMLSTENFNQSTHLKVHILGFNLKYGVLLCRKVALSPILHSHVTIACKH